MADSLLTDLVSWWSLEETSGQRADAHGTNHLTQNGTVGNAAGKIGNAASWTVLPSEANNLSVASLSGITFDFGNEFTFAFWVNTTNSIRQFCGKLAASNNGFRIFQNGNGINAEAGGLQALSGVIPPFSVAWYHVAVWFDGSVLSISVNGSTPVSRTISSGTLNNAAPFRIGTSGFYTESTAGFSGMIDEFGVWSRVLTSDERTRHRNGGAGIGYADLFDSGPVLRSPHALNYLDPSQRFRSPYLIGNL